MLEAAAELQIDRIASQVQGKQMVILAGMSTAISAPSIVIGCSPDRQRRSVWL